MTTSSSSAWSPRDIIRWGIVGCGDVTEVKSGPGFQKAANSRLVAVMRRNAALAQDYAQRHGVSKWYSDADALINDPEVDAVYIATPPGSHLEYALRVAAAGKPAYVEKPMARNTAECERMVAAFKQARLPLFVAYYRRGQPRTLKAKSLLEEGALGKITSVRCHYADPRHRVLTADDLPWRVKVEDSGGGVFVDMASHTLDLLDYFFGPLEEVEGHAANLASPYAVEDTVSMSFRTGTGVPGVASWNYASAVEEDVVQITGTDARLTFATFTQDPLLLETANGKKEFSFDKLPHVEQPLIQLITDELRGHGHSPSTGESGLRTTRVMDRVLDSYYGGRQDAFWTRPESWPGLKNY